MVDGEISLWADTLDLWARAVYVLLLLEMDSRKREFP